MSKYHLTEWGKPIEFNKLNEFNGLNYEDLSDIIKFTGIFKNESELKLFLLNHKLIKEAGPLKITYRNKNQLNNLKYGVTYYDNLKYFSEKNLKIVLQQNKNDYQFLESLSNYIKDNPSQKGNYIIIKNKMLLLQENPAAKYDENEINNDIDYMTTDLVRRECHSYNSKTKVISRPKIRIRGLRDLAMFLSWYEKKYGIIAEELDSNEYLEFASEHNSYDIEQNIQEEIYNQKVKTKKKETKGQMTFFIDENGNVQF